MNGHPCEDPFSLQREVADLVDPVLLLLPVPRGNGVGWSRRRPGRAAGCLAPVLRDVVLVLVLVKLDDRVDLGAPVLAAVGLVPESLAVLPRDFCDEVADLVADRFCISLFSCML